MCWQIQPWWPLGLYIYWNDCHLFWAHNTETETLYSPPSAPQSCWRTDEHRKIRILVLTVDSSFCFLPHINSLRTPVLSRVQTIIAEPSPHFSLNQIYEWVSGASCVPRCVQRSCRSLMQQHTFKTSSADFLFVSAWTRHRVAWFLVVLCQCVLTDSQQLFFFFFLSSCFCNQLECSHIMSPTICRM